MYIWTCNLMQLKRQLSHPRHAGQNYFFFQSFQNLLFNALMFGKKSYLMQKHIIFIARWFFFFSTAKINQRIQVGSHNKLASPSPPPILSLKFQQLCKRKTLWRVIFNFSHLCCPKLTLVPTTFSNAKSTLIHLYEDFFNLYVY